MKSNVLLRRLYSLFPKEILEKYHDYGGKMVGKLKNETNRIFICLDFDEVAFNELLKFEMKPDLIITHHPFIYGKKADVLANDAIKRDLYYKLLELDIPLYSFHTNFDEGNGGMNDILANKLQLKNIRKLVSMPMARGGDLETPMSIDDLSKMILQIFDISYCTYINGNKKMIESIAIIGGGGWNYFDCSMLEGYDCFISGDIPHHGRRDIISKKYNYIDVPHEIENVFMNGMKKILLKIDNNLEIQTIMHEKEPTCIKL